MLFVGKGSGVFATRDIAKGELVSFPVPCKELLIEWVMLVSNAHQQRRTLNFRLPFTP